MAARVWLAQAPTFLGAANPLVGRQYWGWQELPRLWPNLVGNGGSRILTIPSYSSPFSSPLLRYSSLSEFKRNFNSKIFFRFV